MVKIISLFNHKGGVSKTTTTFHLGWILAEMGKKVLIVDTDPQCNLTGVSLSLAGNDDFESFYAHKNIDNIKSAIASVFEGLPVPLQSAKCYEYPLRENLFLLPGHIDFSEYDIPMGIAQELNGSIKLATNIPGAISHLLRITAEEYGFEYILIDMSPSVSALNANLLMQSDYFIVPCSPDYYCNMAISSLTKILPSWYHTYDGIKKHVLFKDAYYKLPDTSPKFIGTIQQKYRPRNQNPARSFRQWIDRIDENVNTNLVPALREHNMLVDEPRLTSIMGGNNRSYNLANISDFNGLIAQSQKYNTPVFSLSKEQIEQVGKVLENSENSRDMFHEVFSDLAKKIITLTQ